MTILKGTFTSVWDNDVEITTQAELDTETGEVSAEVSDVDVSDLDILEEEYFEDLEGNRFEVCTDCHEYIMVTSMEPGIGHDLNEVKRCKNPDCETNQ